MAIDINSIKYLPELPAAKALTAADLMLINQQSVDGQVTLERLAQFFNDLSRPIGSLIEYGDKNCDPNNDFPGQTWVRLAAGFSLRVAEPDDSNTGTTGGSDEAALGIVNIPPHDHELSNAKTVKSGKHIHGALVNNAGGHNHPGSAVQNGGAHGHAGSTGGAGGHDHEYVGDDQLGVFGGAIYSRPTGRAYDAKSKNENNANFYRVSYVGNHVHSVAITAAPAHSHGLVLQWDGDHVHVVTIQESGEHEHALTGKTTQAGGGQPINVMNKVVFVAVWKRTK